MSLSLSQDSSLYSKGMQPLFYSEADAKSQKVGWRRTGHAIKYFKSSTRRPNVKRESFFYCLTWSHTFQHGQDTCYFAHCYPYTYSDLQDDLGAIQMDPLRASCCKQRTLCHTLAGNPVPILTITSPAQSHEDHKVKREGRERKGGRGGEGGEEGESVGRWVFVGLDCANWV